MMMWSNFPKSQSCEVAQSGKSRHLQSESEISPQAQTFEHLVLGSGTIWGGRA